MAIVVTLREDVGLRWFGPGFIAPGAKLPEANFGEEPPAAPVIHVSREWITVRAKRVASADEAISDRDLVVEGLYEELWSIGEAFGKWDKPCEFPVVTGGRIIPSYGPEDDLIIQADRDVEYELLVRVLYTCGRAEYGRLNLAAVNPESRELEVFSLELPYAISPSLRPPAAQSKVEPRLLVGDNSFELSYREAPGAPASFNIGPKDYPLLAERLRQMKRRCPEQKSLVISCGARVEYDELIQVIEILVQREIRLTEIYLTRPIENLEK